MAWPLPYTWASIALALFDSCVSYSDVVRSSLLEPMPPPEPFDPELGQLAAALLGAGEAGSSGGPVIAGGDHGTWSLADAVPRGGFAAVALLEHLWAEPLVGAIRSAGGQPLAEGWIAAEDLVDLGPVQG